MDTIIQFLIEWSYLGMFVASFLAGSIIPFSSEAVLVALVHPATGLDLTACLVSASIGNTLGGMTCYSLGRLGKTDWLTKFFRMDKEKIDKMQIYLHNKSGFMGFFAFLPILGSIIAVALGFIRSNFGIVSLSMFVGKSLRYFLVILAARGLFSFFI